MQKGLIFYLTEDKLIKKFQKVFSIGIVLPSLTLKESKRE